MQHNTTQLPSAAKNVHTITLWSTLTAHYQWAGGGRDERSLNCTIKDLCQRSHQRSFIFRDINP